MFGSVTVRDSPCFSCLIKSGITEPHDAITFPYQVAQTMGPKSVIILNLAVIIFSTKAFQFDS